MKHAKHTPGPWNVEHTEDSSFIIDGESRVVALADISDSFDVVEHKANARLIAAAPRLATFLDLVLAEYNAFGFISELTLQNASDFLNKTTGGSNE